MTEIEALASAIAKTLRPAVPVDVDLWGPKECAAFFKCSESQFVQYIKTYPDFPKPISVPLAKPGLGIAHPTFGGSYQDGTGRTLPRFHLSKDLTLTLVSGYNVQMRHRIVTRWMELESGKGAIPLRTLAADHDITEGAIR